MPCPWKGSSSPPQPQLDKQLRTWMDDSYLKVFKLNLFCYPTASVSLTISERSRYNSLSEVPLHKHNLASPKKCPRALFNNFGILVAGWQGTTSLYKSSLSWGKLRSIWCRVCATNAWSHNKLQWKMYQSALLQAKPYHTLKLVYKSPLFEAIYEIVTVLCGHHWISQYCSIFEDKMHLL